MNLLNIIKRNYLGKLSWLYAPEEWTINNGILRITTPKRVDFFRDPSGVASNDSAPFLYANVKNNFITKLHLKPNFKQVYDQGSLIIRENEKKWCKLAFEKTDYGTNAIVSVITNDLSDDANSVDINQDDIWLQIVRVNNTFGMQYSLDGIKWRMVRYFNLPVSTEVKVGLSAASPIGRGVNVDFLYFSIESKTVSNIRYGY
jgi:regulation of enolase protein 1 (concanavalin A-like superfamily)